MRMRPTTTLLLAALAALPGCACDTVPADAVQDCQAGQVVPDVVQTDILFVIDDSGSMSQEQANLRDNLAAFIDALVASPVENDFRIGVTSTAVEAFTVNGSTAQAYPAGSPAAGTPYPDGALVAVRQRAGGAITPGDLVYDLAANPATLGWGGARILDKGDGSAAALAALARDFKANVLLGIDGSGKEQPFRAARLALSDRLADANAGFLRPGARLAIIFVTDEDDCSDGADPQRSMNNDQCHDPDRKAATPPLMDPVEDFTAFLFGPIGGELRDVVVGVIAGFGPSPGDPATLVPALCSTAGAGQAYDSADRFAALQSGVGAARMRLGSICDASFADTLQGFAEILMPSSMPLAGAPADWRMLLVSLSKAAGGQVACPVAAEGTAAANDPATGAIYSPPAFGRPAQLTFQNACTLGLGDVIDVRIVCVN
jgi:hypothetical protein